VYTAGWPCRAERHHAKGEAAFLALASTSAISGAHAASPIEVSIAEAVSLRTTKGRCMLGTPADNKKRRMQVQLTT
jgi:hypothetical protein